MKEEIMSFTETIGNKEYRVIRKLLDNTDLKFYIENPRVYSLFDRSDGDPTQEEMENKMCKMEDVKELKSTIESNGGLINPLKVKNGELIVLEGNRRLAAYRLLSKKDPDKWKKVICDIYPEDIGEDAIFILLGQCHINGQKKWAPFEEAGYIYRRIKSTGCKPEHIANELGIDVTDVRKRYKVYKFMIENDDLDSSHWSHYDEYLKNNDLKTIRKQKSTLDSIVVKQIKGGKIGAKEDIREKLGLIAKECKRGKDDLINQYMSGEKTLDECASEVNLDPDTYKCINKFRNTIMDSEFKRAILKTPIEEGEKYLVELELIEKKIHDIIDKMKSRKE